MALTSGLLGCLKKVLKPGKLASMGYPDIIAPENELESLLGPKIHSVKFRDDSEEICKRHAIKDRRIVDSRSFFACLGVELTVFDVVKERGEEIICDLNYPFTMVTDYDFVIDIGTLEHCFNVSQALMNMAGMVKVGGYILHENPFNWGNHGFYGLNPTLFSDFYQHNGFRIAECYMVGRGGQCEPAELSKRFVLTGGEANILTVAQRLDTQSFSYPVQTKYKHLLRAA
jgi:hypothetical protein